MLAPPFMTLSIIFITTVSLITPRSLYGEARHEGTPTRRIGFYICKCATIKSAKTDSDMKHQVAFAGWQASTWRDTCSRSGLAFGDPEACDV